MLNKLLTRRLRFPSRMSSTTTAIAAEPSVGGFLLSCYMSACSLVGAVVDARQCYTSSNKRPGATFYSVAHGLCIGAPAGALSSIALPVLLMFAVCGEIKAYYTKDRQ